MKRIGQKDFEIFSNVKTQKKSELLKYAQQSKKKNTTSHQNEIENRIVIEIDEEKSSFYIKQINLRKKRLKKLRSYIIVAVFLLMAGTIGLLTQQFFEYQYYLSKNEEVVMQSKKYLAEQKLKKEELSNLKSLTLQNINTLPEERKNMIFNIIPSGKPLVRDLHITSNFGMRLHPISKQEKEHKGVDLKLDIGDEIIAPAMGKVSFAGVKGGYGNTIIIDHMYGFQTLYAHLDRIDVKEGEIVGKGKIIGAGGNSGSSTGPHLHYEILYEGKHIEPENFINWDKFNFNIVFNNEKSVPWEYFLTIMGKN